MGNRYRPARGANEALAPIDEDTATGQTVLGPVWQAATPRSAVPLDAKNHLGVWLPAHERHLSDVMMVPGAKRFERLDDGRPAYQRHKYRQALTFVKQREVFVDIGAHCGLWSMQAEQDFASIVAFEPHPVHGAIYPFNLKSDRWILHRCALGAEAGFVRLDTETGSSGNTHVAAATQESDPGVGIAMHPLDSFGLERIDLLKIDTEGYELPIVVGATDTLRRCRPVVVIEQKGKEADNRGRPANEALAFLSDLGFVPLCPPISGDHFLGLKR